jgi:hypothetical protein
VLHSFPTRRSSDLQNVEQGIFNVEVFPLLQNSTVLYSLFNILF